MEVNITPRQYHKMVSVGIAIIVVLYSESNGMQGPSDLPKDACNII